MKSIKILAGVLYNRSVLCQVVNEFLNITWINFILVVEEKFCPTPGGMTAKTVLIFITFIQHVGISFVIKNRFSVIQIRRHLFAKFTLVWRKTYRRSQ